MTSENNIHRTIIQFTHSTIGNENVCYFTPPKTKNLHTRTHGCSSRKGATHNACTLKGRISYPKHRKESETHIQIRDRNQILHE